MRRLPRGDGGATAVEYALMIGLIALVIVGVVTALGGVVAKLFEIPCGPFTTC